MALSQRSNRWLKPSPVDKSTRVALSTNSVSTERRYAKVERPITRKNSANFHRRIKHKKKTYATAIERPAPLEKTRPGIRLKAVAKQNQRPVLIRDRRKTIHPTPAAKTSSIEACPIVLGFHVVNAAAFLSSWKLPRKFAGLLPNRCVI